MWGRHDTENPWNNAQQTFPVQRRQLAEQVLSEWVATSHIIPRLVPLNQLQTHEMGFPRCWVAKQSLRWPEQVTEPCLYEKVPIRKPARCTEEHSCPVTECHTHVPRQGVTLASELLDDGPVGVERVHNLL